MAAVSVIARSHFVFSLNFADSFKAFSVAETIISLAFFNQFICIFFVKLKTFALNIRTVFTALVAAFVSIPSQARVS